ncbi:MAG: 30S ribosomal protein S24e [Thermoplasmata archaeon]|nr:MAG: 30S ribosomal protein S24e [Thermoplasmata archaeon]HDN95505.1 30S ribosomal protein S24e [Thermoplasmatales archaeon]
MEIEVEKRRENKLLEREEIECIVKYEGATPPRKKIKEELKNALGLSGYIVIHKIEPFFGMMQARVYAKVYPSEEIARKIEEDYILKREAGGKKAEQPQQQQQAEAGGEANE